MIKKTLFLLLVSLFLMTETFAGELQIIDKPILWSDVREQLIREYATTHYNLDQIDIIPKAVVVHWTASGTWESAYKHFYHEACADGTLNVASHFLVSRDGKMYRTIVLKK